MQSSWRMRFPRRGTTQLPSRVLRTGREGLACKVDPHPTTSPLSVIYVYIGLVSPFYSVSVYLSSTGLLPSSLRRKNTYRQSLLNSHSTVNCFRCPSFGTGVDALRVGSFLVVLVFYGLRPWTMYKYTGRRTEGGSFHSSTSPTPLPSYRSLIYSTLPHVIRLNMSDHVRGVPK